MKKVLYQYCQEYSTSRTQRIQKQIAEVGLALTAESKSTAGDKHETGRAMLQLEREKLGQQLAEAEKTQEMLKKVPMESPLNRIGLGSLVTTTKAMYYIAISAGRFQKDDTDIFCISPSAPMAKLLLGKTVGDTIIFNGIHSQISAIQ